MIRNYLYNMYMNHLMIMVPSFDPHIPPPISGVPGQRIMIHGIIQQVMYSICTATLKPQRKQLVQKNANMHPS